MKKRIKIMLLLVLSLSLTYCSKENDNAIQNDASKILNLIEKSDLDNNVLFIYNIDNTKITYQLRDGWEIGWESDKYLKGNELCRGSGVSFARCVKREVDSGKCVTIRKEGDEYVATQAKCQDLDTQQ